MVLLVAFFFMDQEKKEPHEKRKASDCEDHQDPTKSSKRKKSKMEEIQHIVVVQKCKHPVLDGGARIEKLKRDSDVMSSLMYEMFCLLHERDANLFKEADAMLENALTRMNRLRRNRGMEFVGRWRLQMDSYTDEEANKRGEAYIELLPNMEGSYLYGDREGTLQGELTDDNTLKFSWQSSASGENAWQGVGHLRFADFHSDEDRIEGAFDLEVGNVPQELAYCTFKAQRQLDTIIEEFVGL